MVTLLYHSKAVGHICKRIAAGSDGKVRALCDKLELPDWVHGTLIRWDSRAELRADRTINSPHAVRLSRRKKDSRLKLDGLCPPTWTREDHRSKLLFPCIIRPNRHYAAQDFYVCQNLDQAKEAISACGKGWYASPVIDKKFEFRVFVLQGYILKVVRRYHEDPDEIAWNAANDGRSVRIKKDSWPTFVEVLKPAVKAGALLGLDWYAADVIVGAEPLVLELNTAPGIVRPKTIEAFTKAFIWTGEHEIQRDQEWLHPSLRKV